MKEIGDYLLLKSIDAALANLYYTCEPDTMLHTNEYLDELYKGTENDPVSIETFTKTIIEYRNKAVAEPISDDVILNMAKQLYHINRLIKTYYKNNSGIDSKVATICSLNKACYKEALQNIVTISYTNIDQDDMKVYMKMKLIMKKVYSFIMSAVCDDPNNKIDSLNNTKEESEKLNSHIYWRLKETLNN